jgi:hypothetical protein
MSRAGKRLFSPQAARGAASRNVQSNRADRGCLQQGAALSTNSKTLSQHQRAPRRFTAHCVRASATAANYIAFRIFASRARLVEVY